MRRYWIPELTTELSNALSTEKTKDSPLCTVSGDWFHHIFQVCRHQVGEQFEILGAHSEGAYWVQVLKIEKKKAQLQVLGLRNIVPLPTPPLILNLSVPKFPVLDSIVEKAVEIGVAEIRLFTSRYSHLKKVSESTQIKWERLDKIIISATQQSGRNEKMRLTPLVDFETSLKNGKLGSLLAPSFIAYEAWSEPKKCKSQMQSLSLNKQPPEAVLLWIGSEGGFHPQEFQLAIDHGLVPLHLGPQILRVETACLCALSALKYELELF